ncbi:MAG: nitroreductase family protein [Alistipes sp.]|nr:nitroreductase family protein [Alistipes sp.]
MEFKDLINKRRSTRRFIDKAVDRDTLRQIMEQALTAPSAKNTRSTRLLAVTDRTQLECMAQMRDFGAAFLSGATAAVVVMGDSRVSPLWLDNAAITATILQLAAVDAGLASCWVHVNGYRRLKDDASSQLASDYLKEFLPIPAGYDILCVMALGYADYTPKPLPEYEGDERILFA